MGALLRKAWRSSRSERVQLMRLEPEHDARFHSVPSAVDDQDDSETYAIVKKLRNYAFRGQEAPGVERIAFIRNGSLRKALRDILQEHCPESASPAAREGASSSGRSGGAKGAQYYGACDIPKELHPDFDDTTAVGAKASENTAPSRGAREPAQQQFVHPVLLSKRRIGVWLNLNMPDPEITGIIFCLMKKALQESELMQLGSLPFTEFDTAMHEVTKEVRDCLGKYGLTS